MFLVITAGLMGVFATIGGNFAKSMLRGPDLFAENLDTIGARLIAIRGRRHSYSLSNVRMCEDASRRSRQILCLTSPYPLT